MKTVQVTSRIVVAGALVLMVASSAATVLAVDGAIEINQAKAEAGGVTPGDAPGFPVDLNLSGRYVLTSDLNVPALKDGIHIAAQDVTLDLNGFTVKGSGGTSTSGITVVEKRNVEVRNGTVRDFPSRGVYFLDFTGPVAGSRATSGRVIDVRVMNIGVNGIDIDGTGGLVRGCTAEDNGFWGIAVTSGGMVIDSVSQNNIREGLQLDGGTGYRGNVVSRNNGGNSNAQVSGGVDLGGNLCGTNTTCP